MAQADAVCSELCTNMLPGGCKLHAVMMEDTFNVVFSMKIDDKYTGNSNSLHFKFKIKL